MKPRYVFLAVALAASALGFCMAPSARSSPSADDDPDCGRCPRVCDPAPPSWTTYLASGESVHVTEQCAQITSVRILDSAGNIVFLVSEPLDPRSCC